MPNDFTLIFSLVSLGLFGGLTHCTGMCGPFVITQATNRLQETPLEKFKGLEKIKNLALIPYHLGRITTYSLIGFLCSLLSDNIRDLEGFRFFSAFLLYIAAFFFLNLVFERNLSLSFKSSALKRAALFTQKIITPSTKTLFKSLFKTPRGFRGYLLGVILGFIPCGLLYGAFLIAASIANPFLAAIGMCLFGLATFPSLFLTACGGGFLQKFSEFKIIAKALILVNGIMLLLMATKLVF